MNGHVDDAVTGYFNLTLIYKRSKEHSIQSERKRKSNGKPLCSSEQWRKRGQEPCLSNPFVSTQWNMTTHERLSKTPGAKHCSMNKKLLRSKASALRISSLDLNSNENITFCFSMLFRFNFVSTVFFLIQQEMPTVMFVNIMLSCR